MLVERIEAFVATPETVRFSDLDIEVVAGLATRQAGDHIAGPAEWQAFIRCLDAVQDCKGLTSVAVTKILHRKRPWLTPLNDSRVRHFYDVRHDYSALFAAIRDDLERQPTREMLAELASGQTTPAGRPLTDLRALDIVIWMAER